MLQKNPQQQQQQKQNLRQQLQTTGTINAIGSAGMRIDANGQTWNVAADKNCKVEVTGTVDASFLKPGMLVRFTSDVDKKGKTTAAVSDLELVSPQNAGQSEPTHAHGTKKTLATAAAGPSTVMGPVKEIKNNELTVENGNATVKAELSPKATVKVDVTDPRMAQTLAQPGDKVEINGYYTQPPNVLAQEIRITLSSTKDEKKSSAKSGEKPSATSAAN